MSYMLYYLYIGNCHRVKIWYERTIRITLHSDMVIAVLILYVSCCCTRLVCKPDPEKNGSGSDQCVHCTFKHRPRTKGGGHAKGFSLALLKLGFLRPFSSALSPLLYRSTARSLYYSLALRLAFPIFLFLRYLPSHLFLIPYDATARRADCTAIITPMH